MRPLGAAGEGLSTLFAGNVSFATNGGMAAAFARIARRIPWAARVMPMSALRLLASSA
jgi:hypothetical protein